MCTAVHTCTEEKRRVCDTNDLSVVRLVNGCGDDLGIFSYCDGGKECVEAEGGKAQCLCVPTDDLVCFGKSFLYEPSGTKRVDSCGTLGETVTECQSGQVCYYNDQENSADPVCTTSLNHTSGPMGHRGCSFIDYLTDKTDLAVNCRCQRHPAKKNDFYGCDTSGNVQCMTQTDSWAWGWTEGTGPHFRHLTISANGGGVRAGQEVIATKNFTDPTYQGAGMVVADDTKTGNRRVVSGRYPDPALGYVVYGGGYASRRSVGTGLFESTTFPGAWDLEQAADGTLYVWGSVSGN